MTPYELRIMLQIYITTAWRENFSDISQDAQCWINAIEKFEYLGLLENDQASDRLKVYMEAIVSLPLPTKQWVMP